MTWLTPDKNACAAANTQLLVTAGSNKRVASVSFFDGKRRIARVTRGTLGLYNTVWRTKGAAKGKHRLRVLAVDSARHTALATRTIRVCGK